MFHHLLVPLDLGEENQRQLRAVLALARGTRARDATPRPGGTSRERHALDEISIAYTKLGTGTFGICEDCGGELPLARLRAVPATRYCLSCQTRRSR